MQRTCVSVGTGPDNNVRYRGHMVDRRSIDRAAWAALIQTLVDSTASGNQTQFAKKVGVTSRTVNRWLKQDVAVDSDNVVHVALALGQNPTNLLVQVGYLTSAEASTGGSQPLDPDVRAILAKLADPDTSAEQQALIRQMLRSLAALPMSQNPGGGKRTAAQ